MPNTLTFEDIVEVLEQRSLPNFGKITCSIISGMCYLTGNTYPEVDLDNDFYSRRLYGTFTMYPYNTIYFYKEKSWLVPFLQQNYWVKNSIIPHYSRSHDLPTIVKIKRSNGNMHDVLTNQEDYGIRIRKSSSLGDDDPRFYVRVFWINNMPVLDPSKIAEYENIYDMEMSFKDVLIEDIVKLKRMVCLLKLQLLILTQI
jgi:hypothetical protein